MYSSGVLTLAGNAPLSDYVAVLGTLSYTNLSHDPGAAPRVIEIVVNDGADDSLTVTATINVVVNNNPPAINLDEDNSSGNSPNFATQYPQTFAPAVLTDGVRAADPDNDMLTGAAVR